MYVIRKSKRSARKRTKVVFASYRGAIFSEATGSAGGSSLYSYFQAYNAGWLREACQLFAKKYLDSDVTVGMTITGALTPAGLGGACIVPLMKAGFVDWIVSTGANLYHDTQFAIGKTLHQGNPFIDDRILRREGVIRIYDILFDYDVLLSTDAFYRKIIMSPELQKPLSTAEFHFKVGKYVFEREKALGIKRSSVLASAYKYGVPIYTSSPVDSSIGMNVAEQQIAGNKLSFDTLADVNETASIVFNAKRSRGKSAVLIFGGGSPKNFILQTEPQMQEVVGIEEKGHDYFIQITDARPDTGGLSGATPSEAVSWGKIDPDKLPEAVVAYLDSTVAVPILTSYALAKHKPRKLKRLADHKVENLEKLKKEYFRVKDKRKYAT
jgi:deoxyhypusine synthase